MALKLGIQILRSYFQLICICELHVIPNAKAGATKDHRKNYMKVRTPLIRHLWRNRLSEFLINGIEPFDFLLEDLKHPHSKGRCVSSHKKDINLLASYLNLT